VSNATIDQLLAKPAFIPYDEKLPVFTAAMRDALAYHRSHSSFYEAFLRANNFGGGFERLSDIPPLPIGIFKTRRLVSVPESEIVKVTHSSATTSGTPSTILIDRTTRDRQRMALSRIIAALLGDERRPFLLFESRAALGSAAGDLSSRATTSRGLLAFSSSFSCLLDDGLRLRSSLIEEALAKTGERQPVFFGVTTMLHEMIERHRDDIEVRSLLAGFRSPTVLISGGWKKLAGAGTDPEGFKADLADFFSVPRSSIIDFYGMIEQPGVIYPECAHGYKHVPTYAEVIVRDMRSMRASERGDEGMIEVLSPLAQSYPGIALLTDDVGRIEGSDGCECGRPGQYFSFVRRAPEAEAKGCADTLEMPA
jgi:phenylacetate-coenzyme A ligase PaaK-like adenylate-forming protein